MNPGIKLEPAVVLSSSSPSPVRVRSRNAQTSIPSSTTRSSGSSERPPGNTARSRGEMSSVAGQRNFGSQFFGGIFVAAVGDDDALATGLFRLKNNYLVGIRFLANNSC